MPRKTAKKSPQRRSAKSSRQTPLELVTELMAIPGTSGQEGAIMERVCAGLLAAGADPKKLRFDTAHKKTSLAGQVGNLSLKLPGTVRGPRRLLTAHTDTVPVCLGSQPVRRGKVIESADPRTGLGADDRSGTALLLATAERLLRESPPHYPVTFLWLVQEEVGLQGVRHASLGPLGSPKLVFNFDGGSPTRLGIGATGGYRLDIDVHGLASHAGVAPDQGVSAIAIASLAIADLFDNGWHGLVVKGKQRGTSNVGVIEGGAATNVVTDRVELRAEARSHNPKFRERIVREIKKSFERAAGKVRSASGKRGSVEFRGDLDYESFLLPKGDPSVQAAAKAIENEGLVAELEVFNGGLDANWLTSRGLPAVTIGCGQHDIHTVSETLDIAEFELACRLAERLITPGEAE